MQDETHLDTRCHGCCRGRRPPSFTRWRLHVLSSKIADDVRKKIVPGMHSAAGNMDDRRRLPQDSECYSPSAAKCKYNHSNAVSMDKESVIKIMKSAGGYTTPHLNDKVCAKHAVPSSSARALCPHSCLVAEQLYLHNNNFQNIAGLEDFTNAKVIWLQVRLCSRPVPLQHCKTWWSTGRGIDAA